MEVFGEGFDVLVEGLFYVFEDWEAPGEVVERGVGGVAGEVVVVAPLLRRFDPRGGLGRGGCGRGFSCGARIVTGRLGFLTLYNRVVRAMAMGAAGL